ncbi:MAG: hypothetical protein QGF00_23710 [Planctomycetota bacterium]|jgi:hypothetical protein|nr:hypothetical protein [Planctomycetota bacterium]MDP7252639.1 hypothetical protein [Planctomycetota bacterium]
MAADTGYSMLDAVARVAASPTANVTTFGVLKVQADRLDREYLENWASELNVTDPLTQALDDAGLA